MQLSKRKTALKRFYSSFILTVMSFLCIVSACRKPEKVEPEMEYQLKYRILYDEGLSGNEIISQAEQDDYDIVFFTEDQLKEAGEKVKDIARDRLAVFIGLSLKESNRYFHSDRIESLTDCDVSASCYSVCKNSLTGETGISGNFQVPDQSKFALIEEMSKYWYDRQMDLLAQEVAAAQQ